MKFFHKLSLHKKIASITIFLITPVYLILFISFAWYQNQKQQDEQLHHYELLLQTAQQGIVRNSSNIESILNVFAYSDVLAKQLKPSNNYSDQVTTLLFDTLDEIKKVQTYLAPYHAEVTIIAPNDDILERLNAFEKMSRHSGNAAFASFYANSEQTRWQSAEIRPVYSSWNYSEKGKDVLAYYQKVYTIFAKSLGVVRCQVDMGTLFASLEDLPQLGDIRIWMGEDCIFSVGVQQPDAQPAKGSFRLSASSADSPYIITWDIAQASIARADSMDIYGAVFAIIAVLYLLTIAVTFILLRSVLAKLRFAVNSMAMLDVSKRHVQFPDMGNDEVGSIISDVNRLLQQNDAQHEALLEKERDKRHFQFSALQFQMNPHFLFNSLHWLQLKAEDLHMVPELGQAISNLGEIYRYNLSTQRASTLQGEIQHALAYISFMQVMKETEIIFDCHCPQSLHNRSIPRFTLQPILENAIKHGMHNGNPLIIRLGVSEQGGQLIVCIENDGKEVPGDRVDFVRSLIAKTTQEKQEGHVGLSNLAIRLRLIYGEDAQISFDSRRGKTTLTLRLPSANASFYI